jgi:hypothetical protein
VLQLLDVPAPPLQGGLERIPLGEQGPEISFEPRPLFQDRTPLILKNREALPLLFQLPPPLTEPLVQRIQDGDETLGIADSVCHDLILPVLLFRRDVLAPAGGIRLRHSIVSRSRASACHLSETG